MSTTQPARTALTEAKRELTALHREREAIRDIIAAWANGMEAYDALAAVEQVLDTLPRNDATS